MTGSAIAIASALRRLILARAPVQFPRALLIALVSAHLLLATLAAVTAIPFRINEFKDGAWFSFTLSTGEAWAFVWSNLVQRFTIYALAIRPAELIGQWTGDPALAVNIYTGVFWSLPLVSLALCRAILPQERRVEFAWPAIFFITSGALSYAFPSESWVTQCAFWPLMFALAYRAGTWRAFAFIAPLSLAFLFTYEAMLFCLPALFLVWLRRTVERPTAPMIAPGVFLFLGVIFWFGIKKVLPTHDPVMMADHAGRFVTVFYPSNLFNTVVLRAIISSAVFCAGYAVLHRLAERRVRTGLAIGLLLVILAANIPGYDHVYTGLRYMARSGVILFLPIVGLAYALTRLEAVEGSRLSAQAGPLRLALPVAPFLAMAAIVTFVHIAESARFLAGWTTLRAKLREATSGEAAFASDSRMYQLPTAPTGVKTLSLTLEDYEMTMRWGLVFQSFLVAPDYSPRYVVTSRDTDAFPAPCQLFVEADIQGADPKAMDALRRHICAINAERLGTPAWPAKR